MGIEKHLLTLQEVIASEQLDWGNLDSSIVVKGGLNASNSLSQLLLVSLWEFYNFRFVTKLQRKLQSVFITVLSLKIESQ